MRKFIRALFGFSDVKREKEIKESDDRITQTFVDADKILSTPETHQDELDIATVRLNEISVKCLRNGLGPLSGPNGLKV